MTSSLLDALRAATAADHQSTEKSFAHLMAGFPESYGRYLLAHARAFPAVGGALAAALAWSPWEERWRDLKQDLAQLDLAAPGAIDLAPAESTAEALGMVYVLEGSRMGSAIILKSIPGTMPVSYLRGGLDTQPWKRVKDLLADETAAAAAAAVHGARKAFGAFRDAGGATV